MANWYTGSDEDRARSRRYCATYRARHPNASKERQRKLREAAISAYGGKCACCGETTYEFLCIDHVDGGGGRHRRKLESEGHTTYTWLKKYNYPEGYRVLCHNCNLATGFYGFCPHAIESMRL